MVPLSTTSSLTVVGGNIDDILGAPVIPKEGKGKERAREDLDEKDIPESLDNWETDPANPRNWRSSKKWLTVAIVSLYALIPPLGSSMMAPGLPEIAKKYAIESSTMLSLTLSIFLLSFAVSPLFLAPLSEMYGRTWVYHIGNFFSIAFNLGCAFSPNTNALLVFRFLSGFSGAAPIAIGGGSITDLFAEEDRASAMSLYTLGPLIGPAIGPVAGGFIAQAAGIKWVFITVACCCGALAVLGLPFLRETYAPVIRRRKARSTSDVEKSSQLAHPLENTSKLNYFWVNLSRPVVLLTRSFICFILSLYMAFLYGIYYLMFATFSSIFSTKYGFSIGTGGLAYLGLGVGFFTSSLLCARFTDQIYRRLSAKNDGKGTPEMRIPVLFISSLITPIGLFWYGWSAEAGIHWIMPIIGTGLFSFGMNMGYLPIQLYLCDAFEYSASATAAAAVFRSFLGFAFPLFSKQMFAALGVGGGNSLLGGVAIILGIPFPIWIWYKGAEMRARNSLTRGSC